MNLRPADQSLAAHWPAISAVLERRAGGIAATPEAYAEAARVAIRNVWPSQGMALVKRRYGINPGPARRTDGPST